MTIASIRILCEITFPSRTMRLWDGSGPLLDGSGELWTGVVLNEGLDRIESALNGEASTLSMVMSGVDPGIGDLAHHDLEAGEVIGSRVRLLIQPCDRFDQPIGEPEVRFTGTIDNLVIDDSVQGETPVSSVMIEVTNRFALRTLTSGSVLSDPDQRARSAVLNPGADADRFCERVPGLVDKVILWPRFT